MLSKPQDLAVMFGIFALVIVTVGFALTDINSMVTTDYNNTYFSTIEERVESETGLQGAKDNSAEGLTGEEGSSEEASETGIILQGIKSLRTLGQTWAIVQESADESIDSLSLNPIYLTIIIALITISFAVVIYAYIRGIQP